MPNNTHLDREQLLNTPHELHENPTPSNAPKDWNQIKHGATGLTNHTARSTTTSPIH